MKDILLIFIVLCALVAANGWRDIFAHAWFHTHDKFDLNLLRNGSMLAPWVPDVKDEFDTSRFEKPSQVEDLMKQDLAVVDEEQQKAFVTFGPHIKTL